jgi:hypothetical protein
MSRFVPVHNGGLSSQDNQIAAFRRLLAQDFRQMLFPQLVLQGYEFDWPDF